MIHVKFIQTVNFFIIIIVIMRGSVRFLCVQIKTYCTLLLLLLLQKKLFIAASTKAASAQSSSVELTCA